MNTNTDQHYITKVLEGDTQAFAVLVERYKDLVFTLAIRLVKHREDAEEVAQDVFIKVFQKLSTFKGDSKFSTWIYKITYYTGLDRIKKQKRSRNTVGIDEFTEHEVKTMETALDVLENKEREAMIQNCLNEMPAEDSFLLTLYYFEDQSIDAIAKVMQLKANNVKVKLFRSRKKLSAILRNRLEPEILESYEK